ncbi:TetR/AcrR family transcriptional regulator [Corynebacterium sp. 335C]
MRKDQSPARTGSRSRGRLREATTALLDERDAADITVTDVVAAAGVTRPTFYAAYPDLGEVFADAALHRLIEAFAGVDPDDGILEPGADGVIRPGIRTALERLEPHVGFFSRVLRGPSGIEVLRRSIDYVAARILVGPTLGGVLGRGPVPGPVAAHALAAGAVWAAYDWSTSEERRPLEQLADDIGVLLHRSVVGGLGDGAAASSVAEPDRADHCASPTPAPEAPDGPASSTDPERSLR